MSHDVEALRREEFPFPAHQIYLNAASTGPLPRRTLAAVQEILRGRAAPFTLSDERLMGILASARRRAAALIGADHEEIALATNTTYGVNLAAGMLPWQPGDVVVVSAGEFPANVLPWRWLARRGVRAEIVPVTAEGWPDEARLLERVRDPAVRALAVSHVQFHTGYRADLDTLSAACRAHGAYLIVDAIQALGVVPFDVRATPVDILACGAQKWLLSPWGAGFVYVRRELIPTLEPAAIGWLAVDSGEGFGSLIQYNMTLHRDARRYEQVTLPFQDFAGMITSLALLSEIGPDAARDHLVAMHEPVRRWAARRGVRVATPDGARAAGILALAPPEPDRVNAHLAAAGIVASVREGLLRLSPHVYTTLEEMERVVEVLEAT